MTHPPVVTPRFELGWTMLYPGAMDAIKDEGNRLLADHLEHAFHIDETWISGVDYRGTRISVITRSDLREIRIFAKSELLAVRRELSATLPRTFLA